MRRARPCCSHARAAPSSPRRRAHDVGHRVAPSVKRGPTGVLARPPGWPPARRATGPAGPTPRCKRPPIYLVTGRLPGPRVGRRTRSRSVPPGSSTSAAGPCDRTPSLARHGWRGQLAPLGRSGTSRARPCGPGGRDPVVCGAPGPRTLTLRHPEKGEGTGRFLWGQERLAMLRRGLPGRCRPAGRCGPHESERPMGDEGLPKPGDRHEISRRSALKVIAGSAAGLVVAHGAGLPAAWAGPTWRPGPTGSARAGSPLGRSGPKSPRPSPALSSRPCAPRTCSTSASNFITHMPT